MVRRKPLKVLFIGPDCSGKSSIAQRVGIHYGIHVEGHRKLEGAGLFAIEQTIHIVRNMGPTGRSFIWDQFYYPVDVIYERVLGESPSPLGGVGHLIAKEFDKNNVIVFFVNASEQALRQRFEERGDELWSIEQILKVREGYMRILPTLGFRYHEIDTTHSTTTDASFAVIEIINNRMGDGLNE
jgi:thymidylate kinase